MADAEKKKPGLALVIEASKNKGSDMGGDTPDDATTDEDEGESDASLSEAWEALKSDDEEGFKTAMKAFKAC